MIQILVMYGHAPPSDAHVERLSEFRSDVRVIVVESENQAIRHAAETEIILGHRYLYQTLPFVKTLKWVQSTAGGPHHLLTPQFRAAAPLLTRCPEFSADVAWFALSLAMAASIRLPMDRSQPNAATQLGRPDVAMIIGVGTVGQHLAQLLHGLGIRVIGGVRTRSPAADEACDELYDGDGWRHQLPRAGWCFITLPAIRSTEHLIDESALRALPEGAVVINVGRGSVLDTAALVRALEDRHLGAAALDVIDPAPIGPDDPIWSVPGLLLTPKRASFVPDRQPRLESFIEAQVGRYLAGDEPLYRVELDAAER
jgi:phosphoglycerate dehydrogenase-like enzyme